MAARSSIRLLKSGTNQLHGSGFEYYRDTFMNNGDYFASQSTSALPSESLRRHARWPNHQEQALPVRGLPGIPQPHRNHHPDSGLPERHPSQLHDQAETSAMSNNVGQRRYQCKRRPDRQCHSVRHTWLGTGCGRMPGATPAGPGTALLSLDRLLSTSDRRLTSSPRSFNSVALTAGREVCAAGNAGTALAPLLQLQHRRYGRRRSRHPSRGLPPGQQGRDLRHGVFQSSPSTDSLGFGGSDLPGFGTINAEHFKLFSGTETHTFNANNLNELRAGYFASTTRRFSRPRSPLPAALGFDIYPNNSLVRHTVHESHRPVHPGL